MGQFGLNNGHHWSCSTATPYSSYLGASSFSSCAASGGFNTPALGFTASAAEAPVHDNYSSPTNASNASARKFNPATSKILLDILPGWAYETPDTLELDALQVWGVLI